MHWLISSLVLATSVSFFAGKALAKNMPSSNQELCNMAKTPQSFQQLATHPETRIGFSNHGGLINGGVCWWHSRLQRAAIYLASFRPDLAKPSIEEAKVIISHLRHRKGMITIPGFRNFNDFSFSFKNEIQDTLEAWQKRDGFLRQSWIRGLAGASKVSEKNLAKKMDELYLRVNVSKEIVYQKLQMPGVVAHAWLVIGMTKTNQGYTVYYIDSNDPVRTEFITYKYGDRFLFTHSYGNFVPYTEENDEIREYNKIFAKECGQKIWTARSDI